MSNVGYATLTILPSARNFKSALSKEVGGDLDAVGKTGGVRAGGSFVGSFKGLVGPALALAGGALFGGFVASAAAASDATDKFKATMNFAGLDTSAIDAATAATKAYADQTVYDLPTIQNTTAQLAANGVKDYMGLTKAAGNLNAVAGGNAETFKSVAMVMTQTAGAGKLTTENWNQMANAIPGASGKLMSALLDAGAYTGNFREAMEKGEITADEFNAAVAKVGMDPIAVEAAKSVTTFEGALGNLEATINSGLMTALDALKPSITGVINLASDGLGKAFDWVGRTVTDLSARFGPAFQTIGDTVRGVWDIMAKGDFKPFAGLEEDSGIVSWLFTIREQFMSVWGTISTVFGPVLAQVPLLIQSFSPLSLLFQALEPVLPALAAAFGQLGTTVGNVLAVALSNLRPLIQSLVTTLSGVFVALMPTVVQLVQMLGNTFATLAPVLFGVINAVVPLVTTLIGQLAPILTNLVTAILPPVVAIFGDVVGAIGPLITQITANLVPVIQALMPVVVTVFSVVADVVRNAMQIVQGIIQVVTGVITGNWSRVWDGIGNIFGGVWNTIVSLVGGAIRVVWSVIQSGMGLVGSIVSGALGNVGRFFADTWNNVVNGVSGMIGNVTGFFGGLLGKITGAIGNAGSALWGVGRNIIQGLIDGIGSMMGAIGRAILSLVPGPIVGVFKDLLGIHSPSRVFRGFGVNIGEGLVLGIQDMYGDVEKAVSGLMPETTYTAPTIQAGGVQGAIASAALAGAGSGQPQIVQENHFNTPMDEATYAELAARKLLRAGVGR